jgi:hypothetical protein
MGTSPSLSAKPMSLSGVKKPISAALARPGATNTIPVAAIRAAIESFAALRAASTLDVIVLFIIFAPS